MAIDKENTEELKSPEDPPVVPLGWKPNIVAFTCHYCAFAAADLAGVMRLRYSPNVKIIRIPCTGRLDHIHILRAFERGIDGVFAAGCLEGQCHFLEGNYNGKKRVNRIKGLLYMLGIDPERLVFFNLSAAMGPRWAAICNEFTNTVTQLGPSPIWLALQKNKMSTKNEKQAA